MDALSPLRLYARLAPTERGGFRLARLARRLVPRHRWQGIFDDGRGNALDLDLSTYPDVCMAAGLYERDTDRLLRRLLPPGGHLVDGGANLGYFTLRLARKAGRIDAFEPDPHNRARLLANLKRNTPPEAAAAAADPPKIRVHPAALSNAPGTLTFHRPAPGSARNHGETSRYGDGEPFDVPAVRADTAVDAVPDLVKLDLEGGELAAVRGMTRWLTAPRPPAVVLEHNPPRRRPRRPRPRRRLPRLPRRRPPLALPPRPLPDRRPPRGRRVAARPGRPGPAVQPAVHARRDLRGRHRQPYAVARDSHATRTSRERPRRTLSPCPATGNAVWPRSAAASSTSSTTRAWRSSARSG